MTIIKKHKDKNNVMIYIVKKDIPDEELKNIKGTFCTNKTFKDVIDHNADVYSEDNQLILRFRKKVLPDKHVKDAYDNIINYSKAKVKTRGVCSGNEGKKLVSTNPKINSNIMGYFDKYSVFQKHIFKVTKLKPKYEARVTRFTSLYPKKWQKVLPLIQDIDKLYKQLAPGNYKYQRKHADQTAFKIPNTAFTTMTVNLSTQMACHTDSGNLKKSLGNLVVLEKGKYLGSYTGYPQYSIAVDVRQGDFALMQIHSLHGNSPLIKKTKDAERLSLVCYLRESIWKTTQGTTEKDVQNSMDEMAKILKKYAEWKKNKSKIKSITSSGKKISSVQSRTSRSS